MKNNDQLRFSHLIGIFCISASALLLEVCLTRLLAVAFWYHFAFMIISGGLLGFGAASIVVSLWKKLREAPLDRTLSALSAFLAIATIICYWISQILPLQPFSLSESSAQVFYFALTYLLLTFPFFIAGLGICLLLARLVRSVTLLYALDLAGAGVGSVLALAFLSLFGGLATLVIASAIAALGAAALAWPLGKKARVSGVLLVILFVWLASSADGWLPLRISGNKLLGRSADHESTITRWSATGRVDVAPGRDGQPWILIDGGVAAARIPQIDGDIEDWNPPREGFGAALVVAPSNPSVLIIGASGGIEVAGALVGGAERVVAVEMNEAMVHIVRTELTEMTGGLFHDPRVELVVDEGRSYIRRSDEQFDIIVCSHTISNAAMSSGALSLAENYTLTVEAFEDFFDRLSPGGVIWMTRPQVQLPRLTATVNQALRNKGINSPRDHIVAYGSPRSGFLGGVIVTKTPLSMSSTGQVIQRLRAARMVPILEPGRRPRGRFGRAFEAAFDPELLSEFDRDLGELRPCTDERPYFNQRIPWSELTFDDVSDVLGRGDRGRMAMEDAPVAEVAVLIVLAWACVFSALLVIVPLIVLRRSKEKKKVALKDALAVVPYFVALGLAYITVEICLIQRLGLFVGRPEYALAVVLCSMLISSGAGSLLATKWSERPVRAVRIWLLVVVGLIALHAIFGPGVATGLLGLSLTSRMVVAALFVFPLGFAMGIPLPLGMSASPRSSSVLAWVFGMNCAASVIGSSLCMILSSSLGFAGALFVGAGCYLAAFGLTYLWKKS